MKTRVLVACFSSFVLAFGCSRNEPEAVVAVKRAPLAIASARALAPTATAVTAAPKNSVVRFTDGEARYIKILKTAIEKWPPIDHEPLNSVSKIVSTRAFYQQFQAQLSQVATPPRFVKMNSSLQACLSKYIAGLRLQEKSLQMNDSKLSIQATTRLREGDILLSYAASEMEKFGI